MAILRVFPRRTSHTPTDDRAYIGLPVPGHVPPLDDIDQIHISCTFTWDTRTAYELQQAWSRYHPTVKVGGPAIPNTPPTAFVPGRYIKTGITFTTRGCNNNCPWCLVPSREGALQELDHYPLGHTIQDNNFLQASRPHIETALTMLRSLGQQISFVGGLDARLLTADIADLLKTVPIRQLFLAADTDAALKPLEQALYHLRDLPLRKKRCYVLCGFAGQTLDDAYARCKAVWELGALPFAMLYRPPGPYTPYNKNWHALRRIYSSPIRTMAYHDYRD